MSVLGSCGTKRANERERAVFDDVTSVSVRDLGPSFVRAVKAWVMAERRWDRVDFVRGRGGCVFCKREGWVNFCHGGGVGK